MNSQDVSSRRLDYFAAARAFTRAAELRSFSRAAQELGVKVSTVSRQIRELERDLGIALFNRTTRGLALTEGGRTFLPHALQALASLEAAREAASALNQTPQGLLRISLPSMLARHYMLPQLPAFMHCFPDVDIDAVIDDESRNLIEHSIDLAVRVGEPDNEGLMGRCVGIQPMLPCAHVDYLQVHGEPAHPDELHHHACLTDSRTSGRTWYFAARDGSTQTRRLQPGGRFRSVHQDALLDMAMAAAGIALLPAWLLRSGAASGLRPVLDAWRVDLRPQPAEAWLVYPPKQTVSSKVRAFVDYFAPRLGALLTAPATQD